jgi:hypothetical protein
LHVSHSHAADAIFSISLPFTSWPSISRLLKRSTINIYTGNNVLVSLLLILISAGSAWQAAASAEAVRQHRL